MERANLILKPLDDYIWALELGHKILYPNLREIDWQRMEYDLKNLRTKLAVIFEETVESDFETIQEEVVEWAERNFGPQAPYRPFVGMVEELGELAHALLKKEQGIRQGSEKFQEDAEDAIGDLFIYMCDFAGRSKLSMKRAILNTWNRVKQRNWVKDPVSGGEPREE